MGRVYLCLGQNAELPYYFEKAKVHIWNIEELCYFIRENAWIMEPELLTKELIDWVAQQCGLPKLALLLNDSLKEEDCVTAFAACLFSYTGYCPLAQAGDLQKDLLQSSAVKEVARIHGITPMQVLLAFVLYKENVIAIPRSGKAEHVLQNLEAGKVHLTVEEYARLDAAFPAPREKTYLDIV